MTRTQYAIAPKTKKDVLRNDLGNLEQEIVQQAYVEQALKDLRHIQNPVPAGSSICALAEAESDLQSSIHAPNQRHRRENDAGSPSGLRF